MLPSGGVGIVGRLVLRTASHTVLSGPSTPLWRAAADLLLGQPTAKCYLLPYSLLAQRLAFGPDGDHYLNIILRIRAKECFLMRLPPRGSRRQIVATEHRWSRLDLYVKDICGNCYEVRSTQLDTYPKR